MVTDCCFCDSDEFFGDLMNERNSPVMARNDETGGSDVDVDDFYVSMFSSKKTKDCEPHERCIERFYCEEDRANDGRGSFDERSATVKKPESECHDHEVCCEVTKKLGSAQAKPSVKTTRRPDPPSIENEYCQDKHQCVTTFQCEKQSSKLKSGAAMNSQKGGKKLGSACLAPHVCCEKKIKGEQAYKNNLCKEGRKLNGQSKCGVRNEDGITNNPFKESLSQLGEVSHINSRFKDHSLISRTNSIHICWHFYSNLMMAQHLSAEDH